MKYALIGGILLKLSIFKSPFSFVVIGSDFKNKVNE